MVDKFIPISEPSIGENELSNIIKAVKSGWISSKGEFIQDFEVGFSKFIGTKYGVSTSNGTSALHLALSAIGIGKGDGVIVPDFTFISPINTIIYNGGVPQLVDSQETTWNIDPIKIEDSIDSKTKAIIVVHLYGHPVDMDPVIKIAKKHDLFLIEDCAEAHGAEYKDKKVGNFGKVSCFSFYGNKIMTTGEGGMCVTDDLELSDKMQMLRDHGMKPKNKYWHDEIGYNYRMTNLQAAIGVAQLEKISSFIDQRRKLAAAYTSALKDIDSIVLQPEMSWAKSVFWLSSILIKNNRRNVSRDRLSKLLLEKGIDNRKFFNPAHVMPPYKTLSGNKEFPVAELLAATGINLPSSGNVTNDDVELISQIIHNILA